MRRSGDTIRITAQLIEVSSDAHLWSETWDRAFKDVFAIQDEIAAAVTSALRIQLVDELPQAFVTNPRAYDTFLKARELVGKQTEASVIEAESLLLELLEIDPAYSPALVLLGESEIFLGSWDFRPRHESFERARRYGRRAVDASPTFGGGYVLLSWIAIRHERNWSLAQQLIEKAVRYDHSNIEVRFQASWFDALEGDHEQRIKIAREMVRLDPLSGRSYWSLGHALMSARQYDESAAAFRRLMPATTTRPWQNSMPNTGTVSPITAVP